MSWGGSEQVETSDDSYSQREPHTLGGDSGHGVIYRRCRRT